MKAHKHIWSFITLGFSKTGLNIRIYKCFACGEAKHVRYTPK